MRIFYGKKRWVPKRCPTCHKTSNGILSTYCIGVSEVTTGHYSWYGECISCAIKEEMKRGSLLWEILGKPVSKEGRTFLWPVST